MKQELQKLKTGEEIGLVKAINNEIIKHSPIENIKQVLRLVMIKIGLRANNWPSEEEKVVLIDHIYENFGGHTPEEIRLAFEMAIAGKLELKPDDVKCYENFSCAYFSTIMNAYRLWASQAYKTLPTDVPPPQKIFSQEELDNSAREDVERQYQMFIRGLELRGVAINKPILEQDGLLKEGEDVISFFKRRAENGFQNIYKPVYHVS